MLEAVLGAILTKTPMPSGDDVLQKAVSLAAITPELPGLTEAEHQLMAGWIDRSIEQLQR